MTTTDVPSVNIVHKVLSQDNYELWSCRVKTYLVAKDLWSVVTNEAPKKKDNEVEFNLWIKKNAEALHAIYICCGDDLFPIVNGLDTAKAAWDKLETMFKSNTYQIPHFPVNGGNPDDDLDEMLKILMSTFDDQTSEFYHEDVSESLSKDIRPKVHEYGSFSNAMFIDHVESGHLDAIKIHLDSNPNILKEATSSSTGKTALHIAVGARHVDVVKELLAFMSDEDVEVKDNSGMTALATAATVGNIEIAKYLVQKNERLVTIKCHSNTTLPLLVACKAGKWKLARYLYDLTPHEALIVQQEGREGAQLISLSIYSQEEFEIALHLIRRYPTLIFAKDYYGNSPIYVLAATRSTFITEMQLAPWKKWIYRSLQKQPVGENREDGQVIGCFQGLRMKLHHLLGINHIRKKMVVHVRTLDMLDLMCNETRHLTLKQMQEGIVREAMFQAVEQGNAVFVMMMCKANPVLLGIVNGKHKSLLQFSIECRQEKIYRLLFALMSDNLKELIRSEADKFGNSTLHSAASLSSIAIEQLNQTQGAALMQLQSELRWFKEVENIVSPNIHNMINQDRMTARELFTENHKEMVKEGERQMKEIATSCTVVGVLIVTMMFAAAFTIPGGTNGHTGVAKFLNKKLFKVFIVSDAISLFSSTTSIVIFLGIITSHYKEDDFLISFPIKMVAGLSTLFFSIATMIIAFVSALIITLHGTTWIIILVVFLAIIPITSFAFMQFPLLVENFRIYYQWQRKKIQKKV